MERTEGNLGIEPPVLKEIYRQMTRIRAVDKAIQANAAAGKFRFPYWPMTGQEAIPAVLAQLVTPQDYMVTTYRGVHDQVAKGVDLGGSVRRGARARSTASTRAKAARRIFQTRHPVPC